MKKFFAAIAAMAALTAQASTELALTTPGGVPVTYNMVGQGTLRADNGAKLPVIVTRTVTTGADGVTDVTLTVKALETCWFNISETETIKGTDHQKCEFYMPGFWYHHNMRSPKKAPSFKTSDSWQVREDRLSTPLTGVWNPADSMGVTVMRLDPNNGTDCVLQNQSGDIILPGKSTVGSTGFKNVNGEASLTYSYPYTEAPKRYIRKLTLIDPVRTFQRLEKGEEAKATWQIRKFKANDYTDFVADVWNHSFKALNPQAMADAMSPDEAKEHLASYFKTAYVDKYPLKYYSCGDMRTQECDLTDRYQVGFIGRVLLNAFNAYEYGQKVGRKDLEDDAMAIFDATLKNGFTPAGFFVEDVHQRNGGGESKAFHSVRRQSEGAMAMLYWLDYERKAGRKHPEWEAKVRTVLDNLLTVQREDGSFPRKFRDDKSIVDDAGGSTPCATLPMTMAYKYFGDKRYLESARATAKYLENELINKADYFSSTLDANCEDKEASFYGATALYYLAHVTKGKEREKIMDLCRKAAYFCLSWYYLWDVPFAQGQMLGDVDFKSRGWGNVSVENNHIDVYIFEFNAVLRELASYFNEPNMADFANVIETSMLQLMPTTDNMYGIGKRGYYPEVVQHTAWDYGKNGKGFYNTWFAPGWTVASLWQMLSPKRVDEFFAKK